MCVAVRWVDIGNCQGGYVTGWMNQSVHVTGYNVWWLHNGCNKNGKEMVRYWLDQETSYVLVMHRHFYLMYLAMYDKFVDFGMM